MARVGRARHLSCGRSRCMCCMGRIHGRHRPGRCRTRWMTVASLIPQSFRSRRPACDWLHTTGRTLSLRRACRRAMGQMSPVEQGACPIVARPHLAPGRLTQRPAVRRPLLAGEWRPNGHTARAGHQPLRMKDICHLRLRRAGRRLEMAPRWPLGDNGVVSRRTVGPQLPSLERPGQATGRITVPVAAGCEGADDVEEETPDAPRADRRSGSAAL